MVIFNSYVKLPEGTKKIILARQQKGLSIQQKRAYIPIHKHISSYI